MRKNLILTIIFAVAVLFSFSFANAETYPSMFLRGTFNGWVGEDAVAGNQPLKMKKEGGIWKIADVQITKGRHKYKFEVTGGLTWGKNWGKVGKKGNNIKKIGAASGKTYKGVATVDTAFNDLKTRFAATGKYTFTFNPATGEYTVTKQ